MNHKQSSMEADDDVFSQRIREMHDEELLNYIRGTAKTLTQLADRLEKIVESDEQGEVTSAGGATGHGGGNVA